MEITFTREDDSARYTCIAKNIAGQAKADYNLLIMGMEFIALYFSNVDLKFRNILVFHHFNFDNDTFHFIFSSTQYR